MSETKTRKRQISDDRYIFTSQQCFENTIHGCFFYLFVKIIKPRQSMQLILYLMTSPSWLRMKSLQ